MDPAGRPTRPARRHRPYLWWILPIVAVAWLAVAVAHAGELGHRTHPTVAGWLVMIVAMMVPSTLPMVRHLTGHTLRPVRAVLCFQAGYLAVWGGFGLLAIGVLSTVYSPVLAAGALLAAGGWQLSRAKRDRLNGCRTVSLLPAHGWAADRAAARLGLRHGTDCLGACWAMMFATAGVAIGQLGWMVLCAALVWAEKVQGRQRELAWPSAVGFAVAAAGYAAL